MNVKISDAGPLRDHLDLIPHLAEIAAEVADISKDGAAARMQRAASRGAHVALAHDGAEVVGCIAHGPFSSFWGWLAIPQVAACVSEILPLSDVFGESHLYLKPAYFGTGAHRALIHARMEWGRSHGYAALVYPCFRSDDIYRFTLATPATQQLAADGICGRPALLRRVDDYFADEKTRARYPEEGAP